MIGDKREGVLWLLTKYVKTGIIRVHIMPNGHYDYNEEDVYKFLNKDVKRKTYIYARVSTPKQKPDLKNQIQLLKQFCFANGYTINGIFSDIASGISFEKKGLFNLLDDVENMPLSTSASTISRRWHGIQVNALSFSRGRL